MKPEDNPIIKLVTIDIDRTLIDDKRQVPEANKKAIHQAIDKGCHVVICSGRSEPSVRNIMNDIDLKEMVPSLGGTMLRTWDGVVINDYTLDCETASALHKIVRRYDCYPYIFKGDQWYSSPLNTYWNEYEKMLTGVSGIFIDTETFLAKDRPNKLVIPCRDPEILKKISKDIEVELPNKADVFLSSPIYLEILPFGVNKGTAVKDLIKYFKISKDNALAIGDFYNDIDMFKAAGNKAAVMNAPDDIKAIVDYVSPVDNNHAAVAEILDKYVLSK